jgi:hypothetical protein
LREPHPRVGRPRVGTMANVRTAEESREPTRQSLPVLTSGRRMPTE